MATTEVAVERQKKYVSERGAFEIVSNPEITPRYSWQNTNICLLYTSDAADE